MSGFEDERMAIEARMQANFTATSIMYENQEFDPPDDTAWVALTLLTGEGEQVSLGPGGLQRYAGVIQCDIYVPEKSGTKTARQHADTIAAIFLNKQFSAGSSGTIFTRTPWVQTRGVENGWFHLVLSVTYHRDKTA